jgi:hypothetical protein
MAELTRELMRAADEAGVKLEIVSGLTSWEAFPAKRHQKAVFRIQQTIHRIDSSIRPRADDSPCGCFHYSDIYIRFPDGSIKRPDISIFCVDPDEETEIVEQVPDAVIEVISKGYEAKDNDIGRLFYLAQGIKDVIIFDPETEFATHSRHDGTKRLTSPVKIALECGYEVTV